jgi:hypothetical protein
VVVVYCRFFDAAVWIVRSITASAEERQYFQRRSRFSVSNRPHATAVDRTKTASALRLLRVSRRNPGCRHRIPQLSVVPRPHVIAAIMKQALVPLGREAAEFGIRVFPIVFSAILALFTFDAITNPARRGSHPLSAVVALHPLETFIQAATLAAFDALFCEIDI